MTDENQDQIWPVPKFHFLVTIGDKGTIAFQEVSGLDTEYDMIEYRAGNSKEFSTVKMPGLRKGSDITLKKGIFKDDTALYDYFASVKMNTIQRETVTIELLDEEGRVMFVYTLKNAFPMKVTGKDLEAGAGEVALEELVLAHEGVTFDRG